MKKALILTLGVVFSLLAYRQATSQPSTQTAAETMDQIRGSHLRTPGHGDHRDRGHRG